MAEVLSALDETFLELEELKPGALMNIGGILVFDPLQRAARRRCRSCGRTPMVREPASDRCDRWQHR
ncbi:MAG: hypothetical protein ACXVHL_36015 [Solirubrobacteraceae bacterium]